MKRLKKVLGIFLLALSLTVPSSVPLIGTVQTVSAAQLNYKKLTLKKGRKKQLKLYQYHDKVIWKAKNSRIAAVSKYGVVRAKRVGTTYITATIASGEVYRCKVIVKAVPSSSPASGSSSGNTASGNSASGNSSTGGTSSSTSQTPSSGSVQTATVWLSATGSKYHRIPNCGRMNPATARQVTLSQAISQGYGACSKCY